MNHLRATLDKDEGFAALALSNHDRHGLKLGLVLIDS